MDNSFYVSCANLENVEIEKFHICTWEFANKTSLVEFGCEINTTDTIKKAGRVVLSFYIPWLTADCDVDSFYDRLKESSNSKFIFNDAVESTTSFDGGTNQNGIIHTFKGKAPLCILPISFKKANSELRVTINLPKDVSKLEETNLYIRFGITPKEEYISLRRGIINKTTVIYDIKLNEKRNLPDGAVVFNDCKVKSCFCFNIVPNDLSIDFFDTGSLENIRTLEYLNFNKYLNDDRVKEDELIVVFNKKKNSESYSFFSMYSKELFGPNQILLALILNLFSGFLLFLPSFRKSHGGFKVMELPIEIYIVIGIWVLTPVYFIYQKSMDKYVVKVLGKFKRKNNKS